jgi:hypothetical protein
MYPCLSTAKLSVLVNGSSTQEFQVVRGIHIKVIRYPCFYLTLIMVEGLSVLFHRASESVNFITLHFMLSMKVVQDFTVNFPSLQRIHSFKSGLG